VTFLDLQSRGDCFQLDRLAVERILKPNLLEKAASNRRESSLPREKG